MIVVNRFDVPETASEAFQKQAEAALQAFAARPGFHRGRVGRSTDEPTAWVLTTEWDGVASYRRSLSGYEVKVQTAPLFAWGRDEASAFDVLASEDVAQPPRSLPR